MHTNYHIWGVLSSLFFGLTLYGLWIQLRRIYERKSLAAEGRLQNEGPCASISVNRTFSSFAAFFGNFFLGMSLPHFDWYLVSTRSFALILIILTLGEIWIERKNFWSSLCLLAAIALWTAAVSTILFFPELLSMFLPYAKAWIVFSLFFLLQGYVHQVVILRRTAVVGGGSKLMYQFFSHQRTEHGCLCLYSGN